ncbi:hypothetical protein [Rhizobium leguminosarum]|uniref:hypothetical protein n=1 Tax=Rhizobium leguminosarum TaxID=384 RepID=UPI001C960FF5|nr:hypothetical protein [Rhizobium leguminosarum]MBY5827569.1 hypothetical protein [Rhizobium leguminosarum]
MLQERPKALPCGIASVSLITWPALVLWLPLRDSKFVEYRIGTVQAGHNGENIPAAHLTQLHAKLAASYGPVTGRPSVDCRELSRRKSGVVMSTIGDIEREAGIWTSQAERTECWRQFHHLEGKAAELKRMIAAKDGDAAQMSGRPKRERLPPLDPEQRPSFKPMPQKTAGAGRVSSIVASRYAVSLIKAFAPIANGGFLGPIMIWASKRGEARSQGDYMRPSQVV